MVIATKPVPTVFLYRPDTTNMKTIYALWMTPWKYIESEKETQQTQGTISPDTVSKHPRHTPRQNI